MAFKRRSYGRRSRRSAKYPRRSMSRRAAPRRRSGASGRPFRSVKTLAIAAAKTMAEKKSTTFIRISELDTDSKPDNIDKLHIADSGDRFDFHLADWGMYNGNIDSLPADMLGFNSLDGMKFPHITAFSDRQFNKRVGREVFYRKSNYQLSIVMNVQNTIAYFQPDIGTQRAQTIWDGLPTQFRVFHFGLNTRNVGEAVTSREPSKDIFIDSNAEGGDSNFFFGPKSFTGSGSPPSPELTTPQGIHTAKFNSKLYRLYKSHRFTLDNPQHRSMASTGTTYQDQVVAPIASGVTGDYTVVASAEHGSYAKFPNRKELSFTDSWNTKMKFQETDAVEPYDTNWQRFVYIIAYKLQGERPYLVGSTLEQPGQELGIADANSTSPPYCDNFRVYAKGLTTAYDF